MSAAVIPQKALPPFFQNVEIIDPDALRSCRQIVSNNMQTAKLEGTITAATQPILLSSKEAARKYQTHDYKAIKDMEKLAQQDIGPIHEHLKLHPIDGWTRVRCEGKEFFLTWTDSGSMWARSIEEKCSDDGNSFQVVVQIGTYSQSSQVLGIQTYNITTSVFAPAAVIALIVAGAVAGVIAIGLAVSAAAIATAAEATAGALGYTAAFGVPVGAVTGLVFAVVFAIVFIGLVYLLDWLNRKYTIRL